MVLVDTSVWTDHLRAGEATLVGLVDAGEVLGHPFVLAELALGSLRQHELLLTALGDLPQASVSSDAEVLTFIERERLYGSGIGYVSAARVAGDGPSGGSAAIGLALWRDGRAA